MSIVIFGRVRIRREEPVRPSVAERKISEFRSTFEQRFDRLGELLVESEEKSLPGG